MSPKEYLSLLVGALINHTDQFEITETEDELGTLLSLSVHPDDMGVVIGRNGKTIDALRTILRIYGSKQERKLHLRLLEEEKTL